MVPKVESSLISSLVLFKAVLRYSVFVSSGNVCFVPLVSKTVEKCFSKIVMILPTYLLKWF